MADCANFKCALSNQVIGKKVLVIAADFDVIIKRCDVYSEAFLPLWVLPGLVQGLSPKLFLIIGDENEWVHPS